MAGSTSPLDAIWSNNGGFSWEGKDPAFKPQLGSIWVSHEYGKTINWQIADGRDFSREMASDSAALILNQTAIDYMGLKDPIGKTIRWGQVSYKIIGVVNDLLIESPFQSTSPVVYFLDDSFIEWIEMRLDAGKGIPLQLASIEEVMKELVPEVPFEYVFADDKLARKFESEERIGTLSGIFAIVAIFISCLGLFGLASYVAEQRTKELGVRKVLGASAGNLWQLLSREFVWLVLVSCFIATPIAYFGATSWLQGYEYTTKLSWATFVGSCIMAMVITLLTVSLQTIKAARRNPIESLRSE
jgi:putative ABC transport system permease protein